MPHDIGAALPPSPEEAERALQEDGFIDLQDPRIGRYVQQMALNNFPYWSQWGLECCKKYIFKNELIIRLLKTFLGPCRLGHWVRYKAEPDHIECFIIGGREAGMGALAIHHLAKGSRMTFYRGSHLLDLPPKEEEKKRGMHETTEAALLQAGCKPVVEEFPDGGVVVRAGRLYAKITEGYAITVVFGIKEVLADWGEIQLPPIANLIRHVVKMETDEIQVNFVIKGSSTKETTSVGHEVPVVATHPSQ